MQRKGGIGVDGERPKQASDDLNYEMRININK